MSEAWGRRALTAIGGALLPAALFGGGCSGDPVPIPVDPIGAAGTNGDVQIDPEDTGRVEQCGSDGIVCDDGCCPAGNTCSPFGRCIPAEACSTSNDTCSADSVCGGTSCRPWDVFPEGMRFSRSCRDVIDLPSVIPEVQCEWPGATTPAEHPDEVQVISTPMVVDFNSDGDPKTIHPSIVFISYTGVFQENVGVIRVIDGETCQLQDTIEGEFPFTPEVPVALGDVNGDGRPDIVAADEEAFGAAKVSGIAVFELKGSGPSPEFQPMPLGRKTSASTGIITGFALHDVDGDDRPEIFTDKTMLRYTDDQGLVNVSAIQPPGRPELESIEPPTVIDVDGDRFPEVITPQGVFSWDILKNEFVDKPRIGETPLWNPNDDDVEGAFMASANLGNFPTGLPQGKDSAELVIVGHNGNVWVKTVDGSPRFAMDLTGIAGGPPVIADIDGDGRMEFASGGLGKLTVFDLDCTTGDNSNQAGCGGGSGKLNREGIAWETDVQGGNGGLAVFDFDGDGKAEVVYSDQCFMRVYDGHDGSVLFSTPRMSTTQWDYPVVADTDGDFNSEIVTASNDNDVTVNCPAFDPRNERAQVAFKRTHGVTVWKEKNDSWAGSRPIWNQHNYFVTNVRDDGTIPPMNMVQSHWQAGGPNTFRQNVQGATGKSLTLVDVTTAGASTFECDRGRGVAKVTVDLCNRGAAPLRADSTEVALAKSSAPTQLLCQQRNSREIAPGACIAVNCDVPAPPGAAPFDLQILGDPANQVSECNETNNVSIISRIACRSISVQ